MVNVEAGHVHAELRKQPVVAILTVSSKERTFKGNRENFVDLIRVGTSLGMLVYVTTTELLNMRQQRVAGYQFDESAKKWKKDIFPAPQVIYNRIPYRTDEARPQVAEAMEELMRNPRVSMFNPTFFNKWSLYEWLNRSEKTRRYIPETKRYNQSELEELLRRHSFLYLKPERGKAGKGIMRIRKQKSGPAPYLLKLQDNRKTNVRKFANSQKLNAALSTLIGNKEYVVQQGIVLVKNEERPFDLRVLAQKNGKGLWNVSGIGARVAGESSITTHVPRGGSIDNPLRLLSCAFGKSGAKTIIRRTKATALDIARQIERGCGNTLGEMSMDLGVDKEGNLWFFEANAKPMKFDEPDIRKRSLRRLMEYCLYLAKERKARTVGLPEGYYGN